MTTYRVQLGVLAVTPLLMLSLVACSGDKDEADKAPVSEGESSAGPVTPTAPTEPTTPAAPKVGDDTEAMADVLQSAIPTLKTRIQMTEDNDTNDLFGRPGQYDQVTFLADTRLGCKAAGDFDELSTDCGVKIERWPSTKAAQARADDIQRKLRDYGLGAEYDYIVGRLLVRAAGDFKPSQALEIQKASTAVGPVAPPA